MDKENFQVIFSGIFVKNIRIPEVRKNLVKLFKTDPSMIDTFFSGKKIIVKKNITRQTALTYVRALHNAGIICQIESLPLKAAESSKQDTAISPCKSAPYLTTPTVEKMKELTPPQGVKREIRQPDANNKEETVPFNKRLFISVSICTLILMIAASWVVIHYFQKPLRQNRHFLKSLDMKFVYIPSGTFKMGSPPDEADRNEDEKQHGVSSTKGFYMQTTEVTQRQWTMVMGYNPSFFNDCGDECPVEHVSWNDVQEFIRKLNGAEGRDIYRLPTEAEWEYACRAGSITRFCYGNDEKRLGNYAWFQENSKGRTHPVAQKTPNAWGLFDMHGNAWEWCQDWYGEYPSVSVTDPNGPATGSGRVLRGASILNASWNIRSALRTSDQPDFRDGVYGFRLIRHR